MMTFGPSLPVLALAALIAVAAIAMRPVIPLVTFGLMAPLGMLSLPVGLDLVTVLAAVVVVAAAWDYLVNGPRPLPLGGVTVAAAVWSLGLIASTAFSDDPGRAMVFGAWQILAAWFAVGVAILGRSAQRLEVVTAAVLTGAIITAVTGLTGGLQLQSTFNASVVTGRAIGVFSQPNEYGLYCAMVGAFALGIACLRRGYLRVLGVVGAMVGLAGLALSFSRGAWLGAAVAAIAMAVLIPQTRLPQTAVMIVAIIGIAGSLVILPYWQLPGLLFSRLTSIFTGSGSPYDIRPELFTEGLMQFGQHPILGVGPNMYPVVAYPVSADSGTLSGDHAHNFLATTAAEQGLIGLLAVALFVIAVARAARTARGVARAAAGRASRAVDLGTAVTLSGTGALCAAMGAGLVDYPLRNAMVRLTVWLFLGLVFAGHVAMRPHRPTAASPHADAVAHVSTS
jgi:O-antigen ligase